MCKHPLQCLCMGIGATQGCHSTWDDVQAFANFQASLIPP